MKKIFILLTIMFTAAFLLILSLYLILRTDLLQTAAITLGTFSYHFIMRLAVGYTVNSVMKNRADPNIPPFATHPFEKKLYKWLKVRKWIGHIHTFDPSLFSRKEHTLKEIAGAMCQAEVVHSIIAALSFLPILGAIPFGAAFVFIATSVLSALYDLSFVIVQRYNRPRIIRLINAEESSAKV